MEWDERGGKEIDEVRPPASPGIYFTSYSGLFKEMFHFSKLMDELYSSASLYSVRSRAHSRLPRLRLR
jgi:hypothetical protein